MFFCISDTETNSPKKQNTGEIENVANDDTVSSPSKSKQKKKKDNLNLKKADDEECRSNESKDGQKAKHNKSGSLNSDHRETMKKTKHNVKKSLQSSRINKHGVNALKVKKSGVLAIKEVTKRKSERKSSEADVFSSLHADFGSGLGSAW